MNSSLMELQQAIKQQNEDMKEELNDLNKWIDAVEAKKKQKKSVDGMFDNSELPPIRGTAPTLKVEKKKKVPAEDPIQVAKDQGNEYFKRGDYTDAIRLYSKGIDLDPDAFAAHVLYGNRAMCHLKLNAFDLAEKDASSCVQLNRSYAKGFYRRAIARKNLGKLREARSDLEAVLALAPGDRDAETELRAVTQAIREADQRESASASTKRKKIVIAEVEDEDDEAPEVPEPTASASATNNTQVSEEESEDHATVAARTERIERDLEKLHQQRVSDEHRRRNNAATEEAELNKRRRTHDRVEIIEEDEPTAVAPSSLPPTSIPTVEVSQPPTAAKPEGPTVEGSPSHAKASTKTSSIRPRTLKAEWSKDTIKSPTNFTEFERVYKNVRDNEELLDHLISVVPSSMYRSIFGVNLTPELLYDILLSAARGSGTRSKDIVLSLATLSRVGELAMFFDDREKLALENALRLAASAGLSDIEMKRVRKAFEL
eukprot:CAMPEP_0176452966 /NCGR_PEP_ID=MMETSP0127-20121128/28907_1 /TAXON_ID=938130 /ORGANISM="Platyophrya macrostoma, Strain WH" /LENGTH=486 /DNA_ID=CAMNT_0017841635 /DNA_START=25 /DNA_END=1485 /DNA_ORIENTATION=-